MFPEIEQIRQLLDLLRFLANNWWILAVVGALILLVFLVKNARAILQTLAIACGIGVVLVVAAALFSESAPVIVPSVPTAVPSAPAASSNPLSLLATGACSGAALVIAAVIGGAYLYHRWFRANQNQKQGGQWLPGPNALWGRRQQEDLVLPYYETDEGDSELAALVMLSPDLWGLSAPLSIPDEDNG